MESGLTASDVALMQRDGNDWGGGNSFMWVFALLILLFGGNGFGFGGRGYGYDGFNNATAQEILFGQQFQTLDNKIDRVNNGICDAAYALNNSILNNQISLGTAITNEGRAMQTQLANCCCENLRNVDSVRFDMANYNASTAAAIHAEGEATRKMLYENKIETLQNQINALQLQNAVCGVVKYPMASTYSAGTNPFCGCGCGCNNI